MLDVFTPVTYYLEEILPTESVAVPLLERVIICEADAPTLRVPNDNEVGDNEMVGWADAGTGRRRKNARSRKSPLLHSEDRIPTHEAQTRFPITIS
ncbi:MAG: hypothetical protein EXS64_18345 [Candidatus Latescibacteria bacterium]|nr:hypothetical protein [Candidatus Latescibacterota bacterium]